MPSQSPTWRQDTKPSRKTVATCHQIAGQGAKIGPQLDGIGVRGLDRLLEDVLDPNRNVDLSFRATMITLKNGQSLTGLVLREEGAVIVMADAQGKEQRVSKDQIADREISPLSPMPANWADQIAEKDFHDLMAYLLEQKGKYSRFCEVSRISAWRITSNTNSSPTSMRKMSVWGWICDFAIAYYLRHFFAPSLLARSRPATHSVSNRWKVATARSMVSPAN